MRISTLFTSALLSSSVFSVYISSSTSKTSKTAKPVLPLSSPSSEESSKQDQEVIIIEEDPEEFEDIKQSVQCSNGDYHVSSASELAELYQCDDIIGSVYIHNYHSATIDTGPIQTITGDFVVSNASNLVRINTPKLAVIGGRFSLNELTSLTAVYAPFLNSIGTIDWRVLPILSTVSFESGIRRIKSITISDTSLVAFSGFDSEILDTLNINNNRFLESITSGLKGINEKLTISANAKNIIVSLPQLEWANNITIRDVSSLNLGSIEGVNASLELINNNFQSVKFPKLKQVGGTLSIIENFNLRDIEFPSVEDIEGGLMIVNNTMLNKLSFFPKLQSIGGAIEFIGDFKDASFSKLRLVRGSALINTVADSFDCSKWTRGENNTGSIIRGGKIVCKNGGKLHTVKYDQDGEIVDEDISSVNDARESKDQSSSSNKLAVSGYFLSLLILGISCMI